MISHVLLSFYRSLSRHRLYAALNLFGLAAGIGVFLVLMLVVRYERSFNRWIPDAGNIYRLDSTFSNVGMAPFEDEGTSFVAFDPLRADYPQIVDGARTMRRDSPVSAGAVLDSEEVTFVDPSFLDVIAMPLLSGNRANALSSPAAVVITESVARKYFGTTAALGRTLDISRKGIKRAFTVSAVLRDLPPQSTLRVGLLTAFTASVKQDETAFKSWGSSSGTTYLRFGSRNDARAVAADLPAFIDRHASGTGEGQRGLNPGKYIQLSLVSLTDAHFHDVSVSATIPGVDRRVVLSLGAVGLLTLVTAAINYVNLATARSGLRAREVALRKVMGATRRMLLVQFLGEALALVALAALMGLALTELAVPVVNALGGWAVRIDYLWVAPVLVLLVLAVGLGAGFYPATLLAAYRPASVLAAARTPAGGRMGMQVRNLLVLAQFASAITFGICTLVIDAQSRFLRDADRGFNRQGLIVVQSLEASELIPKQNSILDVLRRVPGVVSVTRSDREPDSENTSDTTVSRPGMMGPKPNLTMEIVGKDYFRTYGVHLVAGRLFDDAHATDDYAGDPTAGRNFGVVLNRRAVSVMGFSGPDAAIGQRLTLRKTNLTVVGVVQDVRFMSPRQPVDPQFYLYNNKGFGYANAAIRFRGVPRMEMMRRLQAAWLAVAPDNPFVAKTADERLADFYAPDQQRARLFSAGAILAVAIACVGLYGLASFNTARRVKEIGIRKVLGASTQDVLLLLLGQFIKPVLIAGVIAWPVAWLAMRGWLAGFDQRIALSPGYFIVATAGALGVSVLTVLGQAWRVARAEPARALRYE